MAVRVELSLPGLNKLMTSQGFADCIQRASEAIAAEATGMGEGEYSFSVKVEGKKYVAIGNVFPNDARAAHDNYENNTLEKAVGAVGLNRRKKHDREGLI